MRVYISIDTPKIYSLIRLFWPSASLRIFGPPCMSFYWHNMFSYDECFYLCFLVSVVPVVFALWSWLLCNLDNRNCYKLCCDDDFYYKGSFIMCLACTTLCLIIVKRSPTFIIPVCLLFLSHPFIFRLAESLCFRCLLDLAHSWILLWETW